MEASTFNVIMNENFLDIDNSPTLEDIIEYVEILEEAAQELD